jgi:hypothetical protein
MHINSSGNVGIGTTSPDSLLEISSSSATDFLKLTSTTSSANPIKLIFEKSSTEQGIIEYNRNGDLEIYNNDSDGGVMIDGSASGGGDLYVNNAGNVGIGTTSPDSELHVYKEGNAFIKVDSGATSPYIAGVEFLRSSINGGRIYNDGSAVQVKLESYYGYESANPTRGGFTFKTAPVTSGTLVDALRIDALGTVGIGTSSPNSTYKLHVAGKSYLSGGIQMNSGDEIDFGNSNQYITGVNDTSLTLATGGSATLTATHAGNVGIGTTSPGEKLEVSGKGLFESIDIFKVDATANPRLRIGRYNAETLNFDVDDSIARIYHLQDELSATVHQLNITVDSESTAGAKINLGFRDMDGTNESTKFTVLDTGSVGIGTTSPGKLLDVNGTFRAIGEAFFNGAIDVTAGLNSRFRDGTALNFNTNRTARIFTDNNDLIIQQGEDDKDIIFKSDDGSGGVTEYFRVDGGAAITVFSREARFTDNVKLKLGSGPDLEMYHNGTNSAIDNLTGDLYISNYQDDGDIIFRTDDGSGGHTQYLRIDGGDEKVKALKQLEVTGGIELTNGNLNMPDNSAIRLGSSTDLQIYHDGSNSYIKDVGTGNLKVMANNLYLQNAIGENYINCYSDDRVEIFHNNSKKLETTSTGVEVTGNIALTGSVQRQISTTHHTFTFGAAGSAAQDYWIPFIGNSELASPNVTHRTIAPYTGILKKAIVHSTIAYGSSAQVRFHRIDNGTSSVFTNDNSTDDVTTNVTADMSTAYSSVAFDFTTGNTFSAGDQIGVSFVRNNTGLGDVAITLVWEYELF